MASATKSLLLMLLALLAVGTASGCIKHLNNRGGGDGSNVASVSLQQLPDVDFDKVRVQVWDAKLGQPQSDVSLNKDQGAINISLHPADYRFQIDYIKADRVILSSIACPDNTKFTLVAGPNNIQIYVCDASGNKFPPQVVDCHDPSSAYGRRQLRLLTNREYQRTVEDLTGMTDQVAGNFPKELPNHGFKNIADNLLITDAHAEAYYQAAVKISAFITSHLSTLAPACNLPTDEDGCATTLARDFGKKAWRGPLGDDEVGRLLAVYRGARQPGVAFNDAAQIMLQAMLIGPRFLYRYELGDAVADHYELNAWELAQALSYLYWGTMPDDALSALAASGDLLKPEVTASEAKRLLADARCRQSTASFVSAWLGSDGVLSTNKNTNLYPQFDSAMRLKLRSETENFFNYVVFDKAASFSELFSANYTVGDQTLADFYKGTLAAPLVNLPAGQHQGLLTQASIISTYSDTDATLPVKRGAFVLRQVFCQELPPPPNNLNTTPPPRSPLATSRERFASHSANPACAICHKRIDGIGFGMEDMDAIGRFQSTDAGKPVDASGALVGLDAGSQTFTGTVQLSQLIAKSPQASLCFATQMQRFATGTIPSGSETCQVNTLYDRFAKGNYKIQDLMLNLSAQDSFRKRHN